MKLAPERESPMFICFRGAPLGGRGGNNALSDELTTPPPTLEKGGVAKFGFEVNVIILSFCQAQLSAGTEDSLALSS